jgi:erythromycin esterase-like protein
MRSVLILAAALLVVLPAFPSRVSARAMSREGALAAATRDMCGKDVVLLGEASHGDGATEAFKVALVQRLITSCHFNAVVFEANHYDFLEISRRLRRRETVTPEMVSSAIGWNWNHDAEFAPLIPFLQAQAVAGRITLGGLQDAPDQQGAFYALNQMPDELTGYLAGEGRADCRARLARRMMWDYPDDPAARLADRDRLHQCLVDIARAVAAQPSLQGADRADTLDMLDNLERCIARDFETKEQAWADGDRSLWLNLQGLATRLPPDSKIIVWAHNVHVARDIGAFSLRHPAGPNLGRYVAQAYGARAFALGFTAASGAFAWLPTEARRIAPPPPDSLEAKALAGRSDAAVYVGPAELRAMGRAPAGFSFYDFQTVDLAGAFDGAVVFQAEYPPTLLDGR